MKIYILKSNIVTVLITIAILCVSANNALSERKIPDDNLGLPVFITMQKGGNGSGLYINSSKSAYFVTAKHVIYDDNMLLKDNTAILYSYSGDPLDDKQLIMQLDFDVLVSTDYIRFHPAHDIAVIKIGNIDWNDNTLKPNKGATIKQKPISRSVGASLKNIKTYDDVMIANEVIVFGFPTSIGLKQIPQIDYSRPLLRLGIVSGKNKNAKTIILDCPVYPGNSGGPVLEIENIGLNKILNIIGVISQYIPAAEILENKTYRYINVTLSNSSYAVSEPMDYVVELIKYYEK